MEAPAERGLGINVIMELDNPINTWDRPSQLLREDPAEDAELAMLPSVAAEIIDAVEEDAPMPMSLLSSDINFCTKMASDAFCASFLIMGCCARKVGDNSEAEGLSISSLVEVFLPLVGPLRVNWSFPEDVLFKCCGGR